jgi:hypothetical protein
VKAVLGDAEESGGKSDGKIATIRPALQINQWITFVVDD